MGAPEAMPQITRLNRSVYLTVIWFLGVSLVLGIAGWLVLAFTERPFPEALGVVIGTVAGGLVGLISGRGGGT
jgi:hypothetical protein